ncbi:serine hydrolase domain-containing protein [Jannaschia rubra]|uniref:serine hydrolase domain-containing protein n=1 Tax=Jannaschia rubra TaxID=282197 RepID=UPI0024926A9F|nr:serine hydrolase [Jannaschia rubra]
MGKWLRRSATATLTAAALLGGVALWKGEEIGRLMAVNSLFDPDRIVQNFTHMDRAFLHVPLSAGPGTPLPAADPVPLPRGADDWIAERRITGLVILKDGRITHESYHLGTSAGDLRISWSVAKSFLSLLTGILIDEGLLDLSDPVTRHVPALAGTAYDGATVEDVLQMESGVAFDEDYFDRNSDINRMGRVLALGGALDDFTIGLADRNREPGGPMQYVSMDTHVLGMVLRGATGRSVPDLMADRLAGPIGLGPAYYLTDGEGAAFVLGGLNMATQDYARLGLLVGQDGRIGDRQIVPAAWIDAATAPTANTAPGSLGYGYQWWVPADARTGEVMAQGIYGQWIYIDRPRDVVVAVNAVDSRFRDPGVTDATIAMFRAIADAQ